MIEFRAVALFLTACFALIAPSMNAAEVELLRPGTRSLKLDFSVAPMGIMKEYQRREISRHISNVVVTPRGRDIAIEASEREISLDIDPSAVGKEYTLTVTIATELQVYKKIGLNFKWVHEGYGTKTESHRFVVDLQEIPTLLVAAESTSKLTLPDGLDYQSLRSKKKRIAECRREGSVVEIRAKKPGFASFVLEYQLQGKSRIRRVDIRVTKAPPELRARVRVGKTRSVNLEKLTKEIGFPEWNILGTKDQCTLADVELESEAITVTGTAVGSSTLDLDVEMRHGRSMRYRLMIALAIVVKE